MLPTRLPGARFDLHLHTTRSDGRFDEADVLERCAAARIDVIALTDHDIASTVDPGAHVIGGHRLQVLAGSEISGEHQGREFHLLVYFPGEVPAGFRTFCDEQVAIRVRRWEAAVQKLGLTDLPEPCTAARTGERALTRLHLAHAMVERGHANDVSDAFIRFLGDAVGNVPPVETPFVDAIRIARSFGGVTAWAHPNSGDAWEYLPEFVAAGLHGIEVLRPHLRGTERRTLRRLARAHGLLVTGGSDWHGWRNQNDLGLYVVRGHELRAFLDALEAAA